MTIYHVLLYCLIYIMIGFATTIILYATKILNLETDNTPPLMLTLVWPIVWLIRILVAIEAGLEWFIHAFMDWIGK